MSAFDAQPVMDEAWAVRGGLGWIGKHTNPRHARLRLLGLFFGELLLDIELE